MEHNRDDFVPYSPDAGSVPEDSEIVSDVAADLINPGSNDAVVNLNHNFVQYIKLVHGQEQHRQRWLKDLERGITAGLADHGAELIALRHLHDDAMTSLATSIVEAADDLFDIQKGIRTAFIVFNWLFFIFLVFLALAGYFVWDNWEGAIVIGGR
jgi:hypothetical protein